MNFEELGLRKVINASGRMSILGVSTLHESVIEAMKLGGEHYVEMKELTEKAGARIAERLGTEAAMAVNSASSGIALSVAGVISKGNSYIAEKLYDYREELPNEILIQKGHNVDYGAPVETMVKLGGGSLKEAGYSNGCSLEQFKGAITPKTAAVLYVKSHHCVQKNMLSAQQVKEICEAHHIPLIIDAAAEENLTKYAKVADLVIYSGSKALEGPTSGIVAGKEQYVSYLYPHMKGIGRAMKIGKEAIFGLLQALENYKEDEDTAEDQQKCVAALRVLNEIDGVRVSIVQDEGGRPIYRGRVQIDSLQTKQTALQVVEKLKAGEIAIYTRDYYANVGYFEIDPRPLRSGDMEIIVSKLQQIVGG